MSKYCEKCGAEILYPDSRFCEKCGAPVPYADDTQTVIHEVMTSALRMAAAGSGADQQATGAFLCGNLMMMTLYTGDLGSAHRYAIELETYAEGNVKQEARELTLHIRRVLQENDAKAPEDLVTEATALLQKVYAGKKIQDTVR
jgi:hypothetical protein